MAKKDNPLHVLVTNPRDIRRHLLLGGVDAIKVLENYEKFKKLKNLKKKKFLDLADKFKIVNQEIDSLVNKLPQVTEEKIEKQVSRIEHKEELTTGRKEPKLRKGNDLQRELRILQDKLSRLNF
ncbi:MAG: hypothetical protein AABW56_01735 [Nanoarchaeota archaeon]